MCEPGQPSKAKGDLDHLCILQSWVSALIAKRVVPVFHRIGGADHLTCDYTTLPKLFLSTGAFKRFIRQSYSTDEAKYPHALFHNTYRQRTDEAPDNTRAGMVLYRCIVTV